MEKILLVVIDYKHEKGWPVEDIAGEMKELVLACSAEVVGEVFCPLDHPSAATLIGSGKVQEIAAAAAFYHADTVIFSHDLKGNQQRNLEEVIHAKTIDRTQLILDIFARRAVSQEGKMQVELAQLEYLLPRLVGKGIALSRLGGGIGSLGPGETKLEVDRRRISDRIARLKRDLKDISANRALKRKKRQDRGVPAFSLVGYTNAGKSTLLNRLTGAEQVTRDGLFTTLDSLSRQYVLPNHQQVIVSDTVGFMHNLPHHLIEAFHATLEEVYQADILIHVLDISHPHFRNLHDSVQDVLRELDSLEKPTITVLNKIDRLEDRSLIDSVKGLFQNPVAVSAKTGENLPALIDEISRHMVSLIINIDVHLPIARMDLISLAHEEGQVYSVKYYNDSIHLRAAVPAKKAGVFYKAQIHVPDAPPSDHEGS